MVHFCNFLYPHLNLEIIKTLFLKVFFAAYKVVAKFNIKIISVNSTYNLLIYPSNAPNSS